MPHENCRGETGVPKAMRSLISYIVQFCMGATPPYATVLVPRFRLGVLDCGIASLQTAGPAVCLAASRKADILHPPTADGSNSSFTDKLTKLVLMKTASCLFSTHCVLGFLAKSIPKAWSVRSSGWAGRVNVGHRKLFVQHSVANM